jgi:hypothetical protein
MTEFNETDWAKGWVTTREVSDRRGGSITIPAPPWHFSGHDGTLTTQVPARQGWRNCQDLWIGVFQATSVPVDSVGSGGVMSMGRSSSLPDRKILR